LQECQLFAEKPCPDDEVCLLDQTPAVCVPLPALEGRARQ
jgi:hypothetical protein